MDYVTHTDFEKWHKFPLGLQMGNIGSEVSKVIRFKETNPARAESSMDRALALIDLTIQSLVVKKRFPAVEEMLIMRKWFCNYYYKNDTTATTPDRIERYYLSFFTGAKCMEH
jgi:hypothetical protein